MNLGLFLMEVFPNYVANYSTQALSSSVVFGDSAKGAGYDASVWLSNEASVEVNGFVKYDCVN